MSEGIWIPVSGRMPKEHESIFAKAKQTAMWNASMHETCSDTVLVTLEDNRGERTVDTARTLDGEWKSDAIRVFGLKVIAWMPFPGAYKGE